MVLNSEETCVHAVKVLCCHLRFLGDSTVAGVGMPVGTLCSMRVPEFVVLTYEQSCASVWRGQ